MQKEKQDLKGVAEVLGHKVDLAKIENPALRRVIRERRIQEFLFFYGDHTDHTETPHSEKYSEYKDYHTDHHEKYHDYDDKYDDRYYDGHVDVG